MSASRNRPADWAAENSPTNRDFAGRIRKMAIKLTSKSTWQVVGHLLLDNTTEVRDAEVFPGIGFYARPRSSSRPDAIVLFVGGAQNPAIVASRDEDLRKAVVAALAGGAINEDETIVFTSKSVMHFKSDGTIEGRSLAGAAAALALQADLALLVTTLAGVPAGVGAGDAAIAALKALLVTNPLFPVGTKKLKGE